MIARCLPMEEWHRLDESLDPLVMQLAPSTSRICVIEEDGEIVARWVLYPILHAEAVWIAPEKRKKGRIPARLLSLMRDAARSLGFDRVMTSSDSEEVTKLLARLQAQPVPVLNFWLPTGKD